MAEAAAKILVIEDDPHVLRIMEIALTRAGYVVVTAGTGDEAMAKIKCERFDLVLTDLAMPVMSGVEIVKAMKDDLRTWRTPVIAVTAHWREGISGQALAAGCDGIIAKPFSTQELLHEVAKHLSMARAQEP